MTASAPTSTEKHFYVAGGTMRPDAPSYVERTADKELLSGLARNEFCHVLTARQMGKSSLMVRAAATLRELGVGVAVLDLTGIGQNLTAEQWYSGLIIQLGDRLDLEDELLAFWATQVQLGPLQRWISALRKVVLPRRPGRLVVFIDEIDAVRSLSFPTDEFFAGIRECYNLRSEDPDIERLTFCLLGVAAPSDLIRDTRTTPFNIGTRIELSDFSDQEAFVLAGGLHGRPEQNRVLLKRILYWTGGHPYLTQRVCQTVTENQAIQTAGDVDGMVETMFFSKLAQDLDNNLMFVRERILRSGLDLTPLLDLYSRVRRGKSTPDDDANPLVTELKLSGITRVQNGLLEVRNRIYKHVFNSAWIESSLPGFELQRQREAYRRGIIRTAIVGGLILVLVAGLAAMALWQRNSAVAQASINRRLLYLAQMKVANQELGDGNIGRVEELLRATTPAPGGEDLRGFEWFLFSNEAHREAYSLKEPYSIASVRFFDGTNTLLLGEAPRKTVQMRRDYRVRLYDLNEQREISSVPIPAGRNFDIIEFSPDLRYAVTDSPDNRPTVWNVRTGELIRLFDPHPRAIAAVSFAPNNRYVACAYGDKALQVWDIRTGEQKLVRSGSGWIHSLAFSPDSRLLVAAGGSKWVELLDAETGKELEPFSVEDESFTIAFFTPDGRRLVAGTSDGLLYFFDVPTRHRVPVTLAHSNEIESYRFSPDGKTLATGSLDRVIKIWDVPSGKEIRTINGHSSGVLCLDWSSDGKRLVSGDRDGFVKVWDVFAKPILLQPAEKVLSYETTAFSQSGGLFAVGTSIASRVKVWNLSTGEEISDLGPQEGEILTAAVSKDAERVAICDRTQQVRIYEARSGRVLITFARDDSSVFSLDFSQDDRELVSGDTAGDVLVWDVSTGRQLASLNSGNGYFRVAFSPDATRIASADQDGAVRLWDVASRRIISTLVGHTGTLRAIAFSPDGKVIATASDDNSVRLWDATTGTRLAQVAQSESVGCLAFTPDSTRLATGGLDGSVRLWDARDMQEVITLRAQGRQVTSVTFSPDGTALAVSSKDGVVKVWQAGNPGEGLVR
jgi:WD40 repeat protein